MTPDIRLFLSSDHSGLARVIDTVCTECRWMSTRHFEPTPGWLHALQHPECDCHSLLVAADAERIVGWCRTFPEAGRPDIRRVNLGIGLLPEYRDLGIGTVLVRRSLAWARDAGCERVNLTIHPDNARAIHVFNSCGFTFVRQADGNQLEMVCNLLGSSGGEGECRCES